MLLIYCRDVVNALTKNSSNGQPVPVSKVGQRREALEAAFPIAYDTTKTYEDDLIDEKQDKKDERRLQYPAVKYWTKDKFKYLDAEAKPSETFPKKLRFLEDPDGDLISQDHLDEMRSHLLRSFEQLRSLMPSLLSNGWLKCDQELIKICYKEMRRLFPELTLCAKNWKARRLIITWYSNFTKNRKILVLEDSSSASEDDEVEVIAAAAVPAKRTKMLKNDSKARKKAKISKGKGKATPKLESDDTGDDEGEEMPEKSKNNSGAKRKPIQVVDPLYASFYYIHTCQWYR
ncbi:hypothetical protein JOM56_004619 [Amanita muscaria]